MYRDFQHFLEVLEAKGELKRIQEAKLSPPAISNAEMQKARARMSSLYSGEYYSIVELTGMNLVFLKIGSPMLYDERETAAAVIYLNELERQLREQKLEKKAKRN